MKTFLRALRYLEIKEGRQNFWWEPFLQNVWILWFPLLYFNFKDFLDPSSSPFIRYQCLLYDSAVILWGFSNLYKLKRGNLNSGENHFCRMSELFGPPVLYFNLKSFMDPNYSSLIVFQCILHGSGVLFSESWSFYKQKRGNQICRLSEIIVLPFCISKLKTF